MCADEPKDVVHEGGDWLSTPDRPSPRFLPPEPLPNGGTAGEWSGTHPASRRERPPQHLVDSPRFVPLATRAIALFGGGLNLFGWFFFGFGMIFVWAFVPQIDFTSWYQFRGNLATTQGTVTAVRKTNLRENEVDVYEIDYEFTAANGRRCQDRSYVVGNRYSEGETVHIEYREDDPTVSRIEGARQRPAPIWVSFVIIFPLIGSLLVAVGLKKGIKANRLLGRGKLGLGTLKAKEPTNTSINDQTVYKLTFEFVAEDGQTYEVVIKAHQVGLLEDDAEEQLLYDPLNPTYAVIFDSLPGAPTIDEAGYLRAGSYVRGLLAMILPTATVAGHGLYIYYRFLA